MYPKLMNDRHDGKSFALSKVEPYGSAYVSVRRKLTGTRLGLQGTSHSHFKAQSITVSKVEFLPSILAIGRDSPDLQKSLKSPWDDARWRVMLVNGVGAWPIYPGSME